MYYDDSYSGGARIGLSSVLLLIIFVSAAALIIAAIVWRPWFNDNAEDATPLSVPGVVVQPADGVPADVPAEAQPAPAAP
jgi:hypothetical protein